PLDKQGRAGLDAFFDGLGRLAAAGTDMHFDALWREYGATANPQDARQPQLAIAIDGSNYNSPYPPADLHELAEANPVTTPDPDRGAPAPVAAPTPSPTAPAPAP